MTNVLYEHILPIVSVGVSETVESLEDDNTITEDCVLLFKGYEVVISMLK